MPKTLEPHVGSLRTFSHLPQRAGRAAFEEVPGSGWEEMREQTSAIRGVADLQTAYRLCLWSRLANRVLLVLAR